jgi:translation initiation factor 2B subunit (eIF-2B alpha/beta/delta family)
MAHPSLETLVRRIRDDAIGGAADMARESAAALTDLARETSARDVAAVAKEIEEAIDRILDVSPSIAPVSRVLHLVGRALEGGGLDPRQLCDRVVHDMLGFVRWLDDALTSVERIGGELIADGEVIFTYSISSTVFRMIEAARRKGKIVSVVTTESRPDNEGLTTLPRMESMGVPVTVGVDAAVAQLMRVATVVYVGADTVLSTGASLCKVGSFPTALVARHYGLPFRITADTSKFDPATLWGHPLVIRPTPASKILASAPSPGVTVRSPVFEVVPAALISDIVTEHGIFHPGSISALFRDIPQSDMVAAKLAARQPS